ncbi:MAG: translation initiation factor IF-2 subunit alpha [Candidatus Micrarchaeia archaeon]
MPLKKKPLPEQDEFVIATVKKIFPYGAFCSLDEYGGKEAFIHISEVAPRWIKNIHEFLKEGQRIVAKVHRFVPEKNLIDLSLKRVTEGDRKRTLERSQREKRGARLLEVAAKKLKKSPEQALREAGEPLEAAFGDVYTGLEELSFNPEAALARLSLPQAWKEALLEVASANIKKPRARVAATFVLESFSPNGVETIKKALSSIKTAEKAGAEVAAHYLGAPNYQVVVVADDYKTAESILEQAFERASEEIRREGGRAALKRAA